MFSFRFALVCLAALTCLLAGCQMSNSTSNNPDSVSIVDNSFQPAALTVKSGTSVTWKNNGTTIHTVTNGTPTGGTVGDIFDSGSLQPGQTFSVTFNSPGTINYFCRIHGTMGMIGVITVQ